MDKAAVFGTEYCRFESCRGQIFVRRKKLALQNALLITRIGPVAQWIRHRSTEPEIVGSSPTRIIFYFQSLSPLLLWSESGCIDHLQAVARLAQSVERQPFKLVVVGSSPTVGVFRTVIVLAANHEGQSSNFDIR